MRADDFPRTIRPVHTSLAVVTAGAYLVSWFVDGSPDRLRRPNAEALTAETLNR